MTGRSPNLSRERDFAFTQHLRARKESRAQALATHKKNWGVGMIIRAIFWIGLVAFLMPHEPDLGYGRPGAKDAIGGVMTSARGTCAATDTACAGQRGYLDRIRAIGMRSLEEVRADIKAHRSHADI